MVRLVAPKPTGVINWPSLSQHGVRGTIINIASMAGVGTGAGTILQPSNMTYYPVFRVWWRDPTILCVQARRGFPHQNSQCKPSQFRWKRHWIENCQLYSLEFWIVILWSVCAGIEVKALCPSWADTRLVVDVGGDENKVSSCHLFLWFHNMVKVLVHPHWLNLHPCDLRRSLMR